MADELGPMPDPQPEEPELVPGGADAIETDPQDEWLPRDLDPDDNAAVDDVLPESVSEPDDKPQAPQGDDDEEADTVAEDAEAGDAGDDGDDAVEPPA